MLKCYKRYVGGNKYGDFKVRKHSIPSVGIHSLCLTSPGMSPLSQHPEQQFHITSFQTVKILQVPLQIPQTGFSYCSLLPHMLPTLLNFIFILLHLFVIHHQDPAKRDVRFSTITEGPWDIYWLHKLLLSWSAAVCWQWSYTTAILVKCLIYVQPMAHKQCVIHEAL